MATIYTAQPAQPQQAAQLSQAPVNSATQDPLFEALVKYISSAPGSSSVTSDQLEAIISSHNEVPGGRAYLESVINPDPSFPGRIWQRSAGAHGFVSTNMNSLTVHFTSLQAHVRFHGTAGGFFGPSVWQFQNARFYYDDTFQKDVPVVMKVKALPQNQEVVVQFFYEVSIDGKAMAELVIDNAGLRLPPQGASGPGNFTAIITTQ